MLFELLNPAIIILIMSHLVTILLAFIRYVVVASYQHDLNLNRKFGCCTLDKSYVVHGCEPKMPFSLHKSKMLWWTRFDENHLLKIISFWCWLTCV